MDVDSARMTVKIARILAKIALNSHPSFPSMLFTSQNVF